MRRTLAALAITFIAFGAAAQDWSYRGNSICYNGAGAVQCYSSGTIQSLASNRDQFEAQFRAGLAIGEGVGNLINGLLAKWAQRNRRVQAERSDLRSQLHSYDSGIDSLFDELQQQDRVQGELYQRLTKFRPDLEDNNAEQLSFLEKSASQYSQHQRDWTESNVARLSPEKNAG
jgi:uncharacterized membrane-anchored protein YhcB (DUF1043 family)